MNKDPYSYFRVEARELLEGLSKGVLTLERDGIDNETVARLLRMAHTLKGAARVVKQAPISESAHGVEDVLANFRDRTGEMPCEDVGRMLALIDHCSEQLEALAQSPEDAATPAIPRSIPRAAEEPIDSVRVEIARIDAALYSIADAQTHLEALYEEIPRLEQMRLSARRLAHRATDEAADPHGARRDRRLSTKCAAATGAIAEELRVLADDVYQSLRAEIERVDRDLAEIRSRTNELRLLSANAILAPLERSVRDAGEVLHKRVRFEMIGGEQRLDAHILLGLRDALSHAVRNSVAHGIESEPERISAGKPAVGRVCLSVERIGQSVRFRVEDDGRGLDVAAIGRVAAARGLVSENAAAPLGLDEAARLLLEGGVSTAPTVSELSGRGVGLNLVRATATRLKGDVHLHSEPGQSTTVEISVPISIESVSVLGAVVDETTVLLPFRAVRQAVRTTERDFVSSVDGLAILVGDDVIPYRWLGSLLNPFGRGRDVQKSSSVVVVQTGSVRVAVGVDRLMGLRDVVVRPLPSLCGCVPLVAGTALNGLGDPELVLDPATLVATVTAHSEPIRAAKSAPRPTVLVVDDSLTTRMLEQSILEAAGFEVDLATSAEEGLMRAREKPHSMFVVDVEMPGMNGFELLKCFRNDPTLQKTPAIMVTSRASAEDRQCAKDAGARDFIVKSEFEESRLLTIVRSLVQEVSG